MFSQIIKYLGLTFFVLFSAISTLIYTTEKEMEPIEKVDKPYITYASFFEDRFFDFRMKFTLNPHEVDNNLVLAEIDDESLKEIGRWPWSRNVWVEFLRKMKIYGAKVVAYDVFFSEEEKACNEISPDIKLAEAIKDFQSVDGNKVVIPYSMNVSGFKDGNSDYAEMPEYLYNFIMDSQTAEGLALSEHYVSKNVYPIKEITDAEVSIGHIQAQEDTDGIFRHYYLLSNVETLYMPSFALQVYEHYTGDKPKFEMNTEGEQAKLKTRTGTFFVNPNGTLKIKWLGSKFNFPSVSIKDILKANDNDPLMINKLKDNIVFVASTAYGAHDLRHSPIDSQMPGVYSHINMVHSLLKGKSFRKAQESTSLTWWILLFASILIIIIQLFNNALLDIVSVVVIIGGLLYIDIHYLIPQGYEVRLFFCFFSVISCYSWNTFLNFYLTNKDKKFLKSAFGSYISPELIDEMYKKGAPPSLGGDSGIRTAFFTDIQGFSTFSEKLSATQLVELLNEYLTAMTDILLEEKGTLDKYEGDAIIAFFGAPMPLEDHATRACVVAHRMQESLLKLRKKWVSEGDKWPEIVHDMRMRVGINSGEIVTGNMGSASRMNYTMMGDTVNLAARLEESAKQYGIYSQVSKETKEMCDDRFLFREIDTVKVMGKSIPVTSYELIGLKETSEKFLRELTEKFQQGIFLYKEQKWDEAISVFKTTLELEYQRFPELKGVKTNPSEIYIERCSTYKKTPPPPEWDGVWTLTKK